MNPVSTRIEPQATDVNQSWNQRLGPIWYPAAVICALPYVAIYLLNLWKLSHYQFFPFLLLACGYMIVNRWGGYVEPTSLLTRASRLFLLTIGLLSLAGAALFASPWFGYFACVTLLAAWLSNIVDQGEPKWRLTYLAIPLLLIWQPPYSPYVTGDGILISRLQITSAAYASGLLDVAGVMHYCPGTVIHCIGKSFGVEEACSGVQSFFALLCFASLLFAYNRSGVIHSGLLLISAVLWAVLVNTIRIAAIPIFYDYIGIDLSHGLEHTILGLITMGLGMFLVVCTHEFLESAFNFVTRKVPESTTSHSSVEVSPEQTLVTSPKLAIFKSLPVFVIGGACLLLQVFDIASSWGVEKTRIDFFADNVVVDLYKQDGPPVPTSWKSIGYESEQRTSGSDLGEKSNLWIYDDRGQQLLCSVDQAFPGWHELTVCYTNVGWKLDSREVLAGTDDWPVVVASFSKPTGEHALLVFSLFNQSGRQVEPPSKWSSFNSLQKRITNRLSPAVRGTLFGLAAYQVQFFVQSLQPVDQERKTEIVASFENAREHFRAVMTDRLGSK